MFTDDEDEAQWFSDQPITDAAQISRGAAASKLFQDQDFGGGTYFGFIIYLYGESIRNLYDTIVKDV